MPDLDRDDFNEEMDRREFRRKRRVRNQMIAYIVTGAILVALVAGIGFGIHSGISSVNERKKAAELQAQLDALSAQEAEEVVVEAPVESAEPEEEVTLSPLDELVTARIEEMPIEDKVAGLFIITPESLTGTDKVTKAGDTTKEKLTQYAVGGLVYFDQNISSADQLKEMIDNTVNYSKYPLFIAVDEEGGSVSRLANKKLADKVSSPKDIVATGDAANAQAAGASIATYLTDYGFNLDFAPVADVLLEGNTNIGDRAFGSNAGEAGSYVSAFVEGLQNGVVSATLKHFPGIGSVAEDAHDGMVVSEKTKDDFETTDFLSFQAGIDAGADFVMMSHLSVPGITGDNTPSSLSDQVVKILRDELSFQGVVITDALNKGAITAYYTADEAAIKALNAGVDMILMPEDFETAYQGVLDAVANGTISEERINESLMRIYRVKYRGKVGR